LPIRAGSSGRRKISKEGEAQEKIEKRSDHGRNNNKILMEST
jgi:hypothetical protein